MNSVARAQVERQLDESVVLPAVASEQRCSQELRMFENVPRSLAPWSCRLCDNGFATYKAGLAHVKTAHGWGRADVPPFTSRDMHSVDVWGPACTYRTEARACVRKRATKTRMALAWKPRVRR